MGIFKNKPFALCAFSFVVSLALGRRFREWALAVCVASAACFFLMLLFSKRTAALVCLFVLLGVIEALVFEAYLDKNVRCYIGNNADVKAVVLKENYVSDYYSSYEVMLTEIDGEKTHIKAEIRVGDRLELERKNEISAELAFSDFEEDDSFDEKSYYNSKNVYLLATEVNDPLLLRREVKSVGGIFTDLNDLLGGIFDRALDGEISGFVKAVFLGDRSDLGDGIKRDFKRTGIYHLLALSGMHLSVLVAVASTVFGFLGLDKRPKYLFLTLLITFYVMMTGCALSAVRSALMLLTAFLAYFIRHERDSLTALAFAAMLITAFSPPSITDIGFLLSVSATFGIIIATPFCERLTTFIGSKISGGAQKPICSVATSLLLSVSAVLMTLPFSIFTFGRMSAVGVVMTVLASPILSVILTLAPLVLIFGRLDIAEIMNITVELLEKLVAYVSDKKYIYISLEYEPAKYAVVIFMILFTVLLVAELRRKEIVPITAVLFMVAFFTAEYVFISNADTEVRYLRDDKNEYFVVSQGGENVLIDISDGSYSHFYEAALETVKYGFCDIDALVLTHIHQRHIVTISRMSKREKLRRVLIPAPENSSQFYIALKICEIAEQNGISVVVYDKGSELLLFGAEHLKINTYGISRSTHPCISLTVRGDIELAYYGSSYLEDEERRTSEEYENTFFGIHGPKAKNAFSPINCGDFVSIADEALIRFIGIECDDDTSIVKNTSRVCLKKIHAPT